MRIVVDRVVLFFLIVLYLRSCMFFFTCKALQSLFLNIVRSGLEGLKMGCLLGWWFRTL